jgi:diguanylate cyclase (GGDEF)-like protein
VSKEDIELEFILDSIREGYWRIDAAGKIVQANYRMAFWAECSPEALEGKPARELLLLPEEQILVEGELEAELQSPSGLTRSVLVLSRKLGDQYCQVIRDRTAEQAIQTRLVGEVHRMTRLAEEDSLTGLLNRRAFDRGLEEAAETKVGYGVAVIDLNDFKEINDQHGHEAGDKVLRHVAKKLRRLVRQSDLVARVGGDEFYILFVNVRSEEHEKTLERVQRTFPARVRFQGRTIEVNGSVGAAHCTEASGSAVVSLADSRMYSHKA